MNFTTEVILCTYNGSVFIVEQLESILGQTRAVDKISIHDDRSSDDTVSRIESFLRQRCEEERSLFRIQINESNLGYAQNFARAIANATEDVLFLCDQDDIWEPEKVETLLAIFREQGPDMVFSDGSIIDHSGRGIGRMTVLQSYGISKTHIAGFRDDAFALLTRRNFINGAAAAIIRTTAQNAFPLPCDMPHDYWLAIWCSLNRGIVATPETLYRYRQHHGNVIGIGSGKLRYDLLGVWRQPRAPRERELRIWKAITERISSLSNQKPAQAARRKLDWLSSVVGDDKSSWSRGYIILKSVFDGSYRRYSTIYGFLRDVVSLFRFLELRQR